MMHDVYWMKYMMLVAIVFQRERGAVCRQVRTRRQNTIMNYPSLSHDFVWVSSHDTKYIKEVATIKHFGIDTNQKHSFNITVRIECARWKGWGVAPQKRCHIYIYIYICKGGHEINDTMITDEERGQSWGFRLFCTNGFHDLTMYQRTWWVTGTAWK